MITPFDRAKAALIDEWKHAWKFWSVQANAIGLALMGFGEMMKDGISMVPPVIINKLPAAEHIAMVFFVLGMVSRVVNQKKKTDA